MGKRTTTAVPQAVSIKGVPQALESYGCKLYAGLLEGDVEVHDLSGGSCEAKRIRCGTGSVRTLLPCGESKLMSALSSGAVAHLDLTQGKVVRTWKAKSEEEKATALLGFCEHVGFVGGEDGGVRHVDFRCADALVSELEHGDYISALSYSPGEGESTANAILAASGDGTLGLYDIRNGRVKLGGVSVSHDDDLLCLGVGDNLVVAGTLEGAIHTYDSSQLSATSVPADGELSQQRHRGHPDSVNAVLIRSGLAVTGCSDGLIRVVDASAGGMLGVIDFDRSWVKEGEAQEDEERWPIEAMSVVRSGTSGEDVLALAGHEECVRFASLSILSEEDGADAEDEDTSDATGNGSKKRSIANDENGGKRRKESDGGDFFGEL